ncbi:alpha/beta hydrolase [Mycoplasmatota bacterium]|nr:alpha/beta hydrolase [Mycoplasmatota bacterium]
MAIFKYNGYDVHYIVDGDINSDKNKIILLNGIMMSTRSWEMFKKPFSKDNTLIRFDMFDQGDTSKLNYNYTLDLQVELLKALLEYLNIEKINLVGISYGASVALKFTVKYQSFIEKLFLANAVSKTSDWLRAIGNGWNEVAKSRNGEAYYNITIPYIYSPLFYMNKIDWMNKRKELLIPIFSDPNFLDAMSRLTISSENHDVNKDLYNITVPTMIISSEQDFLTPMEDQKFISERIKDSELVIIPNCGHASMYEKPELFVALVLGFINSGNYKYVI